MKKLLMHGIDVQELVDVIDKCKGNVFLETDEGDCLNLKSKLIQFVGLTKLIEGGMIAEATLRCELQEDETLLFRYNLFRTTESK